MTKFALLGAALLATALATPALAQAVVEDPGYCAQFYPNSNCQNYGPGNPLNPQNGWTNGYARMNGWHHPHHRNHHHR
jgi:hypothetical protein